MQATRLELPVGLLRIVARLHDCLDIGQSRGPIESLSVKSNKLLLKLLYFAAGNAANFTRWVFDALYFFSVSVV